MIEMKATSEGNKVNVQREIDGDGEEVLNESFGIIEALAEFYADIAQRSKQDVLHALTATLMSKWEDEFVPDSNPDDEKARLQ